MRNSWTKERISLLKALLEQGRSYEQIAQSLNTGPKDKFTRSSVAGVLFRINQQRKMVTGINISSKTGVRIRNVKYNDIDFDMSGGPVSQNPVSLRDLGAEECRWPIGEPRRPGFHFCGCTVTVGPYCAEHAKRAYTREVTPEDDLSGVTLP